MDERPFAAVHNRFILSLRSCQPAARLLYVSQPAGVRVSARTCTLIEIDAAG